MICGIYSRGAAVVPHIGAMLAALPGREQDAREQWADGAAALGWRGDEDAEEGRRSRMPLVHRDAGLAVTASARLDNRSTLCDAAGIPRLLRAETSDGALILAAYERWGGGCPVHLLGDYAFAVWDTRNRRLFCARDHIGARPLYYSLTNGRIVLASDVNAVLAAPDVSDELDEAVVATHLMHARRPLGERTFFRTIRKLPPGHSLRVTERSAHVERWWRPENAPAAPPGDDDELARTFLALYASAVEDRVRGPHPVGVHLSGGLDSSSVAVLAARALRRAARPAPSAFSWQPPPGNDARPPAPASEHGLIGSVCRQEGLRAVYCPPSPHDVLAWLRRDVTREPNVHVNEEPVPHVAAGLRVRTLLSGWGGDEGISFNGRGLYPQLLRQGRWTALWENVREHSPHPAATVALRAVLPLVAPGGDRMVRRLLRGKWLKRDRTFIAPAFARRARRLPAPPRAPIGVRAMQLHLLRLGHLGDRIDGWAASGARHGIVYGYPLLDRRVLEFALGLPPEQFRRGRWSRWLMRHAVSCLLPAEVCWNPSKADPIRTDALRDAFSAALPAVRATLESRPDAPSRSRFLDMPRLVAHIDTDRHHPELHMGSVTRALRLLDF